MAPGSSASADDAIYTEDYFFEGDFVIQLIATGVGEPDDFTLNPEGISTAFTLLVNDSALEEGTTGLIFADANAVHGTPDAPAVDVVESTTGLVLIDDVSYTDISPGYESVPVGNYILNVTPADDNATVLASFAADLTGFQGDAVSVLASGFFEPSLNQDGPGFGILVVETDGTTTFLEPLGTSAEDGAGRPAAFVFRGPFPNPFATAATLRYDLPTDARVGLVVYDVLGREVQRLAPASVSAGAGRSLRLDATALPSGAYLYRLTAETATETYSASGRLTIVR